MHCDRERSLEQQCLELQGVMEQREGEWQQREMVLRQTIADKEELLQRSVQCLAATKPLYYCH